MIGKVRILRSPLLAETGDERVPYPFLSLMAKVELLETVWKLLRTGQPPHHQPRHRRVDKGLPSGTQSLVVFGHPPIVADPREGSLHYPPTRQDPKTPRCHQLLPIHLLALLSPLPSPYLGHLLGDWLWGLAYHLNAHA